MKEEIQKVIDALKAECSGYARKRNLADHDCGMWHKAQETYMMLEDILRDNEKA